MQDEVLILGGGVAGCAASIALARKGRSVTLIEREPTPRHKVCGEFLSGEALEDLHALGIDVASLGAVPIDYVRLAAARRAAEAPLPFPAASLTRKALDTALIAEAIAAGVRVERGRSVQALDRTASDAWQATLDDGTTREAPTVFLATGKHDLRGHTRPEDPERWVAFKMYFRLAHAQAAELARASELMLYPGGYGGIQPVEGGIANLCWVVQQRYLARAGNRWENFLAKMQQDCPHLAMRLAGAEPLLAKPIAITHIPYGYIRRTTENGLYCIGDQAAVIPSFTGDGISIALHTARCAVAAYLAAEPAPLFQAKLRSALRGPDAPCRVRRRWLEQRTRTRGIAVLPEGLARRDARDGKADTRCPARRCCSPMQSPAELDHANRRNSTLRVNSQWLTSGEMQ